MKMIYTSNYKIVASAENIDKDTNKALTERTVWLECINMQIYQLWIHEASK